MVFDLDPPFYFKILVNIVPDYMHIQLKYMHKLQKNPKTQNHLNVTQDKNLNQLFRRKPSELFQLLQKSLYV